MPTDDAALYRSSPVLYYRGLGTETLLAALGVLDAAEPQAAAPVPVNSATTPASAAEQQNLRNQRGIVAESVRRIREPVPAIVQAVAAGALMRPSAASLSMAEAAVLREAGPSSGRSRLALRRAHRQSGGLAAGAFVPPPPSAMMMSGSGSSRELKFCNAHMLHLGIDTRRPYVAVTGELDTPLEALDMDDL